MTRFYTNADRAKRKARALQTALSGELGVEMGLMRCREMVARMYGFTTHNDLLAHEMKPKSDFDEHLDDDTVLERHWRHVAVLVDELGIDSEMASLIVDQVGPTRARWSLLQN